MKKQLEAHLSAAGFDVDPTTQGKVYGMGKVYVLPSSYDTVGVYVLEVYCVVTVGQDIETFCDRVFTACVGSGFEPTDISFSYGTAPITGRDMPPADWAVIDVNNGSRFGEHNERT